jgi:hypothetical protein
MSKKILVLAAAVVGSVAAVVWAQAGHSGRGSPGSLLAQWNGQNATVHLRLESDPRSGRSSFTGNISNGMQSTESVPMSVFGTITGVSQDGITMVNGTAVYWIPRDQIRVIEGVISAP